jgi:two-component system nitrate/nitrite response regulator NarL
MCAAKIRILLVDDHLIVREGIRACISDRPNIIVVGEAADGIEAIQKTCALKPDVVLMDINMPRMGGLEAAKRLKSECPGTKVLILTVHKSKEYLMGMMQSGAQGYVIKDTSPSDLVRAIEAIHKGGAFFAPEIASLLLETSGSAQTKSARPGLDRLGPRERECLIYISQGLSSKEIAQKMGVSLRTCETHRQRLMEKLGIHSVAGLTRLAIEEKLLPP